MYLTDPALTCETLALPTFNVGVVVTLSLTNCTSLVLPVVLWLSSNLCIPFAKLLMFLFTLAVNTW